MTGWQSCFNNNPRAADSWRNRVVTSPLTDQVGRLYSADTQIIDEEGKAR
jgi:hypothetical protein